MAQDVLKAIRKLDKKVSRDNNALDFHFPDAVDQAFKWSPIAAVFVLDALGEKTKNDFKNHLLIIALAESLMNAVLKPAKYKVHRMRPDHSMNIKSFPSGHTAASFLGAEILRHESEDIHKAIGFGAYGLAVTTAALRIFNNKHWLSDVVAGAVLGVVSARAVYALLKKLRKRNAEHATE